MLRSTGTPIMHTGSVDAPSGECAQQAQLLWWNGSGLAASSLASWAQKGVRIDSSDDEQTDEDEDDDDDEEPDATNDGGAGGVSHGRAGISSAPRSRGGKSSHFGHNECQHLSGRVREQPMDPHTRGVGLGVRCCGATYMMATKTIHLSGDLLDSNYSTWAWGGDSGAT